MSEIGRVKAIWIGLFMIALIGFGVQMVDKIDSLQRQLCEAQDYIPSVKEIQQRLCNAGYPVKVDGIWGRETAEALKRYQCDQYAKPYFEKEN